MPALSPDSSLLAYQQQGSNKSQVYLTRFPTVEGRWQVSVDGTISPPVWAPDGRSVYFVDEEVRLMRVSVNTEGGVNLGQPELVFPVKPLGVNRGGIFDISRDGEKFVFVAGGESGRRSLTLVQNWSAEFLR